jgi:cytidylate kinase
MRGVIAIDGPAASGKGTLARRIADHLGRPHLDTGLLYRAVARAMLDRNLVLTDDLAALEVAETLDLAGIDEDRLRGAAMGEAASVVSVHVGVRQALLGIQRRFAAQPGGAVLDGRDIGTVVCPEAEVKLFVTASPAERARRRHRELEGRGERLPYEDVLSDIRARDARDAARSAAPMRAAEDAVVLDTTDLDQDAAFVRALELVVARKAA